MGTQAASPITVLPVSGETRFLVFGLSWFAVVGSQVAAAARSRARQFKATHYVTGGSRAVAGGCVRMDRRRRRGEPHAAAQAYAQLYVDGAYACVVPLPDGRHWLAAAQDGAVITRGDRIYSGASEAFQALDALQSLRPELRVHDGSQVLQRLAEALGPPTRLLPVGSVWMPRLAVLGVAGATALFLSLRQDGAAPVPSTPVDAVSLWQSAEQAWLGGIRIHPPAELRQVVAALYGMPLAVRGWVLDQAQCVPVADAWECEAVFRRNLPGATYLDLARAVPPDWHADFNAMDRTVLRWRVRGQGLTLARLDGAWPAFAHFPSGVQRVAQAFSQVSLGPAEKLGMPAPRDAEGTPVPRPAQLPPGPALMARHVVFDGPLRSLGVISLHETLATWRTLRLTLAPGRAAGLSGSALQLQLEGTVYERN